MINESDPPVHKAAANRWVWELRDLPPIKREPRMPPLATVTPKLAVAYLPDSMEKIRKRSHVFRSWNEVAAWFAGLMIPRSAPGPEVTSTAAEMESDRDLAQFVQKKIRYVAIEIGIGGYRPHFARDTLGKKYGDCKDKVTLLDSLMRSKGRRLYPVLIRTEGIELIPEFPSPLYFNHVIAAVPISEAEAHFPAVLHHPELGRLLLFDPTDERTAFGELPPSLQGTMALLVGPEQGFLVETPVSVPARNRVIRTGRFELTSEGLLKGRVSERFLGVAAARERDLFLESNHEQWIINTEEYLSRWLPGANVTELTVGMLKGTGPFGETYQFVAPHFGQKQDDLYMFRPCVFGSKVFIRLSGEKERKYPLHFTTLRRNTDVFEIVLPEGYQVEQLPRSVEHDSPFALYRASFALEGRILKYVRTLEIKQMSVSPDQADAVRRFYRHVDQDENRFVFLRRGE